ncbi:protein dispatched homolog 1 isoform X2 [Cephus cinctus]|uniref:Protein dispatched homolog 1 isoform X2 n=1 Tax=Cephus cinctus TaxID=211228 RepID=A0AAJ7FUZ6_CEPCN|nr:protein dispatched homolog 1 isoform X2 [Cephus cinctus]
MEVWWFSRVVAHHPYAILAAVFVFSSTCLIVPLTTKKFPDFSDPQLGFEARGTVLAQRLTAWQNLMDATAPRGELVNNPLEYYQYLQQLSQLNETTFRNHSRTSQGIVRKRPRIKNRKKGKKYGKHNNGTGKDPDVTEDRDMWEELLELRTKNRLDNSDDHDERNHLESDGFFCNLPTASYARVVLGSESGENNLWSMEGVLAQCHVDAALRANPEFSTLCQTQMEHGRAGQKCCRSWSPANYVALLSNRSSCLGVTESDLGRVEILLQRCADFYHNLQLTPDCAEDLSCQRRVPAECYTHNAPYHLLHYLLDVDFIPSNRRSPANKINSTLRSAMLFLPIAASSASLDFYRGLSVDGLTYGKFRVLGMQLGLKSTLFDRLLVSDSRLVLAGFAFVTICIWVYTGSLLLTATTILAVLFSLGISYAVYTLVLRITFFPFMNLLAIVVAVGIGADDAFIFCKVWECGKQQKLTNGGLVRLVQETMKHALPSMFVTSLTTAVAFFASIVSNVTAINCFSLFSGMTVIANFFLMVTWLPASVVISEHCRLSFLSPANFIARKIIRPLRIFADKMATGFGKLLTRIAIDLRWLWLVGLGGVAIASCMVVFRYPGLQLPDSPDFQLFDSSHPFERYDLVYARRFWFEKLDMSDGSEVLPLRFVWGVKPVDNGDYLDPKARGNLEWDESFDVSNPKSQLWLQQFCRGLRAQPFYRSTRGPLLPNCFIESLRSWMQRRCEDPITMRADREPCCERNPFPYMPAVLQRCAAEASAELHRTPAHLWNREGPVTAGLKFAKEPLQLPSTSSNDTKSLAYPSTKIKALVVEYDSTHAYSLSFAEMDQFYHQVETWMQDQLSSAPLGMRGGWFVSRLEFYELQRTLYEGTLWAMGVSMILALTVLALVTLNPLVSLYAILAIGAAIVVTVSALVLLNWRLNVLESVAVSTAIGLAVDFSLHYGVSYRACNSEDRIDRVKAALEQMGGPTLMAAVTSGAAGALMLPSHVLAYIQIGVFLLLVMGISWLYATFFLCPLLAVVGPSPHFAQFQYPRLSCLSSVRMERTVQQKCTEIRVEIEGEARVEECYQNRR